MASPRITAPVIRKLVASTIISRWESLDITIDICIQQLARYHCQIKQNLKQDYLLDKVGVTINHLMILAGFPTATAWSGMSDITTAPAPIIAQLPILTLGITVAPAPT